MTLGLAFEGGSGTLRFHCRRTGSANGMGFTHCRCLRNLGWCWMCDEFSFRSAWYLARYDARSKKRTLF